MFYPQGKSIYERLQDAGILAKLYYFDQASSTMEVVNLLQHQPELFGTYDQFLADCKSSKLPAYSFIEPNYTDHDNDDGEQLASDQHPDHNVQAGELYIASVYNAIVSNPALWAEYRAAGGLRRTWRHLRPCSASRLHAGWSLRRTRRHRPECPFNLTDSVSASPPFSSRVDSQRHGRGYRQGL